MTFLQWQYTYNANTCIGSATPRLGNRWEGFHPLGGTETVEAITAPRGYTMECSGNGGTSKQSVIVRPKTVTAANFNRRSLLASLLDAFRSFFNSLFGIAYKR